MKATIKRNLRLLRKPTDVSVIGSMVRLEGRQADFSPIYYEGQLVYRDNIINCMWHMNWLTKKRYANEEEI
jgi:phenylacetate-coenzyme A ligase PaaK-like adenylate-forming protein